MELWGLEAEFEFQGRGAGGGRGREGGGTSILQSVAPGASTGSGRGATAKLTSEWVQGSGFRLSHP